tara:strand:- start:125 stop:451 length:327 start_codon:yes stop_codon:yes gene_type:complete
MKSDKSDRNSKGQFVAGNKASKGHGRPKGARSIPDLLRKIGDEFGEGNHIDNLEAVLRHVYSQALEGKSWAVEFIANRTEGKPHQSVSLHEADDMPIKVFDFDNAVED